MYDNFLDEIKVILLGDCGVGKTNIISRYLKDEFKDAQASTNGSNYIMKNIEINGKKYLANIWDTAGQEKYRAVTKMFVQDSHILILCYSIIDHKSFENLEFWYNLATDILGKNIIIGVAGNKSDLYEEEKVNENEGINFAKTHNAIFKLVSAKQNKESIDLLFEELFNKYGKQKINENNNDRNSVKIDKNKKVNKNEKSKCCF
jgi:small GTP-binding protein